MKWIQQSSVQSEDRTIGIMGLGNIGKAIGDSLVNLDFKVLGWGTSPKNSLGDIEYYFGHDQLSGFLSQTEILINVLPLTEKTKNILTKTELAYLPKGSFIINIGRGGIINENDLISILDTGDIAATALDVLLMSRSLKKIHFGPILLYTSRPILRVKVIRVLLLKQ